MKKRVLFCQLDVNSVKQKTYVKCEKNICEMLKKHMRNKGIAGLDGMVGRQAEV